SMAGPLRSPSTAPMRRWPLSVAAQATAMSSLAGQGTAAKSKSGRAIAAAGRGRYPMPCQTRGTVADASEGAGAAAGRGPPARLPGLLLCKPPVLQAFSGAGFSGALGRDFCRLGGSRIPAGPGLGVWEPQVPEARQEEHAALLRFLGRGRERLVEDALDLL